MRLSRRDFLKLGAAGLGSLWLPGAGLSRSLAAPAQRQGRVVEAQLQAFDIPSFEGKHVRLYWKDNILNIQAMVSGAGPAHNRWWYQLGPAEYVHSSEIQPVQTTLNSPDPEIPAEGRLAEVTVPFTDAYKGPSKNSDFGYRYYYATTYWVDALVPGSDGKMWYRVREDKWENVYYAPAEHLRLVPYTELEPISPLVPPLEKRLVVDSVGETVTAYEYNRAVFVARCSTGARWRTGDYFTPLGIFVTFHKRPSRHMAAGDLASNGYDLPGVPWVCYFTEDGVSFHGTYWHNDYGRRRSHGCINLTPRAAQWVYRWTLPYVPVTEQSSYETYGTLVEVI